MAMGKLFVRAGPNAGEVHPVARDPIIAGRGAHCGIRLSDPLVSREHFRVEHAAGVLWVIDLGSHNGTQLNGVSVERREIRYGDEIGAGATRLLLAPPTAATESGHQTARTVSALDAGEERPLAILGSSEAIRRIVAGLARCAPLDATVLVTGESGTGKELVAHMLHATSRRARGPLVAVNCAAIPRELVESDLFGHEKGAFTGAHARRLGRFELAHKGTLFLDEIGELPAESQAKLLRAVEDKKIVRVGAEREVAVDVRLIAATNRDLRELADAGRFRHDLLYRLEVVRIDLPPLRERRVDIAILARHFLDRFSETAGMPSLSLSPDAIEMLERHDWPGNVRELRNVIERAAIFAPGPTVGLPEIVLPAAPSPRVSAVPLATPPPAARGAESSAAVVPIEDLLRRAVTRALEVSGGNKARAAEMLGISRSSLYNYLDKFGLRRG
jgi:DNA-binding NtrC family response regulator